MLEAELAEWKDAQKRDHELVAVVRIALKLRKGDIEGVVEGFKSLTLKDVSDMYDPALVDMSLELCWDAIATASKSGPETLARQPLQAVQRQLVRQLYRIEVRGPAGSGRVW